MKLIIEHVEDMRHSIVEDSKSGDKQYFIEGIFFQADILNKNGRIYPKNIMENAIDKYIEEKVETRGALGELDHPDGPTVNLDRVSHRIISLKWVGSNVHGKALVYDTPRGIIVKRLLDGGSRLGVSSRGLGSLNKRTDGTNEVLDDYSIASVDIVHDPSAQSAFVNGIMEGAEWIMENNIIKPMIMEEFKETISTGGGVSKVRRNKIQEKVFKEFLYNIKF